MSRICICESYSSYRQIIITIPLHYVHEDLHYEVMQDDVLVSLPALTFSASSLYCAVILHGHV